MCLHYLFILSQHTLDMHPKLGFLFYVKYSAQCQHAAHPL